MKSLKVLTLGLVLVGMLVAAGCTCCLPDPCDPCLPLCNPCTPVACNPC